MAREDQGRSLVDVWGLLRVVTFSLISDREKNHLVNLLLNAAASGKQEHLNHALIEVSHFATEDLEYE